MNVEIRSTNVRLAETRPRLWEEIPPDDGCEAAPKCLECPLSQCRHDDPAGYLRHLQQQKDDQILKEMEQRGLSVDEAAKLFGVATRTIFKVRRRRSRLVD